MKTLLEIKLLLYIFLISFLKNRILNKKKDKKN